jgi:hypothetical protein
VEAVGVGGAVEGGNRGGEGGEGGRSLTRELMETVVGALLACLKDYSTDNRGDVGSWVREAAMQGLAQVPTPHSLHPTPYTPRPAPYTATRQALREVADSIFGCRHFWPTPL